jgi:hypothetical protein
MLTEQRVWLFTDSTAACKTVACLAACAAAATGWLGSQLAHIQQAEAAAQQQYLHCDRLQLLCGYASTAHLDVVKGV